MDAILRRLRGLGTAVVIGPMWLGETLSAEIPTVLLVEPEERERARRTARRAGAAGRRLTVAVAGVDLPLAHGSVDALLIESVAALQAPEAAEWLSTLVPSLREGGRLIAADVTDDPADEALAGRALARLGADPHRAGTAARRRDLDGGPRPRRRGAPVRTRFAAA